MPSPQPRRQRHIVFVTPQNEINDFQNYTNFIYMNMKQDESIDSFAVKNR